MATLKPFINPMAEQARKRYEKRRAEGLIPPPLSDDEVEGIPGRLFPTFRGEIDPPLQGKVRLRTRDPSLDVLHPVVVRKMTDAERWC